MDLKINLESYAPKKTYTRLGIQAFLDPFRQILVPLTADNLLLYKMESYVHHKMGVPKNRMTTQQSLRKYGVDTTKVVSIVIHDIIEGELKPVAMVDCAAPGNPLSFATTTRLEEFAKANMINYLIVTNGDEVDSYISRADRLSFWKIDNVPNYQAICEGHREFLAAAAAVAAANPVQGKPANAKKKKAKEVIKAPVLHHPAIEHLIDALKDTEHKIKSQQISGIQVVRDLGKRKKSIKQSSDATGNVLQRAFLIKDYHHNHQLMCVDIETDASGTPNLSVTLDNFEHRQVIFSLDLCRKLSIPSDKAELSLDLSDLFALSGPDFISGITQEILQKIEPYKSDAALKFKVEPLLTLGSFSATDTLKCDHPEVEALMINLMAFALILDEYREKVKRVPRTAKSKKS